MADLATTQAATLAMSATANRASTQSFDDYQEGHASSAFRALPHGRVCPRQSNRASSSLVARRPLQFSSCCVGFTQLAVAFVADASSFIHRFGRQTSARFPSQLSGSRPFASQSLAHKHLVQILAYVPHVQNSISKLSLRPNHIGRSEKGWRYLISVMRCPK